VASSDSFLHGLVDAFRLISSGDREVLAIIWVSLRVSGLATLLGSLVAIPTALGISAAEFRGKRATLTVFNTLMGLPTVVVGLLAYSLFSRRGPLGFLSLLYTQSGMVLAEAVLGFPLIVALTMAAANSADPRVRTTARSLGASRLRVSLTLLSEIRLGILAAVAAAFGRLISELGIAMMVGGNIRGATRTMTTAIALETSKGDFRLAFALGIVLLGVALAVNFGLSWLARR
jgi:tungstate transport system permease protein